MATKKDSPPNGDKPKERPRSPRSGAILPIGQQFKPGNEARKKGRNGGIKSGEVRRARKTLREELLDLLSVTCKDEDGVERTRNESISVALIKQACEGNTKAFEVIRDTIGEKQKEQVEVGTIAPQFSMLDAAFNEMKNGGEAN